MSAWTRATSLSAHHEPRADVPCPACLDARHEPPALTTRPASEVTAWTRHEPRALSDARTTRAELAVSDARTTGAERGAATLAASLARLHWAEPALSNGNNSPYPVVTGLPPVVSPQWGRPVPPDVDTGRG